MTAVTFVDAEDCILQWFLGTSVAAKVTWGGKVHVYQAMPIGAPVPSVILSRVGGAPASGSDVNEDAARISFSVWAKNRPAAKDICKTLVSEIESISRSGAVNTASGRVCTAETLNVVWFPDAASDMSRYIVDATFVVHA